MLLNLVLAALLVDLLELRGLALALSIATAAEFLTLGLLASRRIEGLLDSQLKDGLLCMLVASAACALATGVTLASGQEVLNLGFDSLIPALVVLLASSAAAYVHCGGFAGFGRNARGLGGCRSSALPITANSYVMNTETVDAMLGYGSVFHVPCHSRQVVLSMPMAVIFQAPPIWRH
jgi:hypothetical protein